MNFKRTKLSKREYQEYLQSEHWIDLRTRFISKYPFCQRCQRNKSTQAHHLRYKHLFDVNFEDLMAMCDPCHEAISRAVKFHIIPKKHKREQAQRLTDRNLYDELAYRQTHVEIKEEYLVKINTLPVHHRRRICGIVKLLCPNDFLEWKGLKFSRNRMRDIMFIIRKHGGQTQ